MKKKVWISALAIVAGAIAVVSLRSFIGESVSAQAEISERVAHGLQAKIDAIKAADKADGQREIQSIEVSDSELESYVLYELRQDIPARVDSIDVQLTPGAVAADTRLTFPPSATGSTAIDILLSGTHRIFVKGGLVATNRMGKFMLQEVRVDGIPVPNILIESLVARYVKPKYPQVDLNEPFQMPWGIDDLTINSGKAVIRY